MILTSFLAIIMKYILRNFIGKIIPAVAAFFCSLGTLQSQVAITASQGTATATYTSVNNAFAAINAGTHKGNILIKITGTTLETGTPTPLLKSATPSNYTSILITPSGDATIYGDNSIPAARAILELVGADNVTINGDDPNTPGKQNLTIKLETTIKDYTAAISLGSKGFGSDDGDSNIVIKNCIIMGGRASANNNVRNYAISFTNNMLVPTITWSGFTTSFAHSHRNITIDSNNIKKAYYGIYASSNDTFPSKNITITHNVIGSDVPDDAIGCTGIFVSNTTDVEGAASAIIEDNDIQVGDGLSGGITNMHVMGIMIYEGNHGIQIRKNNIHDILHIPSSSGAWGIAIQGVKNTSINIVNNFIRDVAAGQNIISPGNAHSGNHGIYAFDELKSLTVINNTIALNKSNSGGNNNANAVSSCVYFATSVAKTTTIANNIFVNNQPSSGTYCFLIGDTANFKTAFINANSLYANLGKIGFVKNTSYNSINQWQTSTNKDAASVNENPNFALPTDLHITVGQATGLESGGLPVSITNIATDYDGDARPGPAGSLYGGAKMPDIGADEFDGNMQDQVGPFIIFTKLGKTCDNLDRLLNNVLITDATGINLTGSLVPRIYFSKNGGNWVSSAGTFVSGNKYQSYWNFTIASAAMGGIIANDTVNYYIVAQDLVSTSNISSLPIGVVATNVNNISIPATAPYSYLVGKSLNGTYTVGAGGNYTTITEAINAYQASCLTGNVTFSLISNDYSTETFPIVIREHLDANAAHTLTIKPAVAVVNINTAASSIFNLYGADYVTIDGSYTTNGTSRNLILNNTYTLASAAIVYTSLGAGKGANHNTIKNVDITMGDYNTSNIIGINAAGDDNDNATIQNCAVKNAYIGISAGNLNLTVIQDSLNITDNTIGVANSGTGIIGFHGIDVAAANVVNISNNTIRNVYTDAFRFVTGIDVSFKVTNAKILRNDISGVTNDYTNGQGSFGISLSSSNAVNNFLIANNFISNIMTSVPSSSASGNASGIRINGTSNIKVYHNSINITGAASGSKVGYSSCIYINTPYVTGLAIKNNILSNTETFSTANSVNYCVYITSSGLQFAAIDNNDYYGLGNSNSVFKIGYTGSVPKATLSEWAGFTGGDIGSMSVDPGFLSDVDLHIPNNNTLSYLESAVPLIAEVNTDFDAQNRPGPTGSVNGGAISGKADIGADEFDRIPQSCFVPTGIVVSNITSSTATFSFNAIAPAPANGYEYIVSTDNALPLTAGVATGVTTINLNSLSDNTVYYIYIRSSCGAGNYSAWSTIASFTTNCLPFNIPYAENFDAVSTPNLPACTRVQDLNIGGSSWITRAPWFSGETGSILVYNANPNIPANNWFYTAGLNLVAGTQYTVGFKYFMNSTPFYTEKLKVAFGTSNYAASMTNIFFDSANIKNKTYARVAPTFIAPTTGIYYIGFNVYSAANQSSLFLDSISVTLSPLPVKLSSFTGLREGNNNILNWTTLTEANNKGFAVERSSDGNSYSTIAFIDSKANVGNSATALNYAYTDSKPFEGVSYYRLKQIDFNGKTDYSNIVKLTATKAGAFTMYPNPAKSVVNISVGKLTGNGKLSIADYLGKLVKEQVLVKGTNTIDIANFAKGMYFVTVLTGEEKTTMKLVVE